MALRFEEICVLCGPRIGDKPSEFGRYVNNKSYPNTHNLIAICDYFNLKAVDFELPHSEFSQKYRKEVLFKHAPRQRTLTFQWMLISASLRAL
jgi:hypothetical protein